MASGADHDGPRYDEDYYRTTYGSELARRLPRLTREQYWARWLRRHLGASPGPVVDLGSGLGWLARSARDQRLDAVSVDISEFSARRVHTEQGLPVTVASATRLPLARSSVAAVVALDVLEHVDDPGRALREVCDVLHPGGVVVVSVPNPDGLGARSKRGTGTWFGDRDPTHTSLWPRAAWIRALVDAGFTVERAGSDLLWDVPYPVRVPEALQRAVLLSAHRVASRLAGSLPWRGGENLVFVGRRP